jgi:hypothetical protein
MWAAKDFFTPPNPLRRTKNTATTPKTAYLYCRITPDITQK